MPADPLAFHGGNLAAARIAFPDAPEPWIDLSTGINPQAYPIGRIEAAAWARLPDPASVARLETIAAAAYGARSPASVVAAPGTQALIQWLPRLIPARRVGILGFTYGEHAQVWRRAGADVRVVETLDDLAGCDVVVVVNPNNPDGRVVAVADLIALAGRGTTLVVDEAFMDVLPSSFGFAAHLPASNCVILRSFGKVYGLAGLRLGFAVASADLADRFREAVGPWAISGPAIAVGSRALADLAWLNDTIVRLEQSASRLDELLENSGFQIVGGTALFRLARHPSARERFHHLAQAGILIRPFQDRTEWLRFGLPGPETEWSRLVEVLRQDRSFRTQA